MREENKNKTKWLHVRLTNEEFKAISLAFARTTEINLSDYIRKKISGQPMFEGIRDQSLQDILSELTEIRNNLNGAANNFNQAVKRMHTLKGEKDVDLWLPMLKLNEKKLLQSIAEMIVYIGKTNVVWLQGSKRENR